MALEDLRRFLRACETGSLSAVAIEADVTQSAVSQQVRRLEREFGVVLLERGRLGVQPTAAGRVLADAARRVLAELERAEQQIERLRSGDLGALRVATGGTTLRHFMTRPLAAFRRRYPNVEFEYVSVNSTAQCVEALREDRADLAYFRIHDNATVEQRPTVRSEWVVVMQTDDPLCRHERIGPDDVGRLRPIALPAATASRSQLAAQIASRGGRLEYAATVDTWDTAVVLVGLGVGHAIVPSMWVHDIGQRRDLRAVPIDAVAPVTFGWGARQWSALPEHALAFVRLVDDGVARLAGRARIELL